MQPYATGVENPHELIGVAADETDPRLVMETAARRIARLRAIAGSESGVRRALIASIIVARNEMLSRIATGEHAVVGGARTTVAARE